MPKDDIKSLLGEAKAELKGVVRPKQPAVTEGLLQPSEGSAPGPDSRRAVVPRPRPRASAAEPTVIVRAEAGGFGEREAPTVPARPQRAQAPANEPSFPPAPTVPALTPSLMASVGRAPLGRLLVVIAASGAAVTGVVAAIGASVVNVIIALRPPSNAAIEQRLQAIETRVNGDFGMKLETKTRQEKDEELEKKIEKVETRVKAISNSLPANVKVKVNPESE